MHKVRAKQLKWVRGDCGLSEVAVTPFGTFAVTTTGKNSARWRFVSSDLEPHSSGSEEDGVEAKLACQDHFQKLLDVFLVSWAEKPGVPS